MFPKSQLQMMVGFFVFCAFFIFSLIEIPLRVQFLLFVEVLAVLGVHAFLQGEAKWKSEEIHDEDDERESFVVRGILMPTWKAQRLEHGYLKGQIRLFKKAHFVSFGVFAIFSILLFRMGFLIQTRLIFFQLALMCYLYASSVYHEFAAFAFVSMGCFSNLRGTKFEMIAAPCLLLLCFGYLILFKRVHWLMSDSNLKNHEQTLTLKQTTHLGIQQAALFLGLFATLYLFLPQIKTEQDPLEKSLVKAGQFLAKHVASASGKTNFVDKGVDSADSKEGVESLDNGPSHSESVAMNGEDSRMQNGPGSGSKDLNIPQGNLPSLGKVPALPIPSAPQVGSVGSPAQAIPKNPGLEKLLKNMQANQNPSSMDIQKLRNQMQTDQINLELKSLTPEERQNILSSLRESQKTWEGQGGAESRDITSTSRARKQEVLAEKITRKEFDEALMNLEKAWKNDLQAIQKNQNAINEQDKSKEPVANGEASEENVSRGDQQSLESGVAGGGSSAASRAGSDEKAGDYGVGGAKDASSSVGRDFGNEPREVRANKKNSEPLPEPAISQKQYDLLKSLAKPLRWLMFVAIGILLLMWLSSKPKRQKTEEEIQREREITEEIQKVLYQLTQNNLPLRERLNLIYRGFLMNLEIKKIPRPQYLPPQDFYELASKKLPPIKTPAAIITDEFSKVRYGEFDPTSEAVQKSQEALRQILKS